MSYPREHAQLLAYIDLAYQYLGQYISNPDINSAVTNLFSIRSIIEPYMYTHQECRLADQIGGYISRTQNSLRPYDTYSDISIALNYINLASTTVDFMCPSSIRASHQRFREYQYGGP